MFSYIGMKNQMFFEALKAVVNHELKGIILVAEDKNIPSKDLYLVVFEDESGYKRSLWCPKPVLEKNTEIAKLLENYKLIKVSRKWHDDFEKIETMVFSNCGIFYYPSDFKRWKETNRRSQKIQA